ncbi:hypothetical protein NWE60_05925 [Mycoplasmopsis felis]|nr:hypothetical protein [Mycoplasmopsis felis]WAM00928.1 hypothetical protein NWE60_05925 [Mycoplasmopsis felis]
MCYLQTEQKVFGGIFISENKENEYQFEVNVEKFDGNVLESDILEEFYVTKEQVLEVMVQINI